MAIKVLICDSADWLAQLQYALMRSGADLQIEAVTDSFRAVEAAARAQPDVIVTEITLDGLGGVDLIRLLLVTVPETHVVCWTVLPSPVTAGEMLGAGASGYVLKEDGPEAVLRTIRSVLDGNVTLSHRVALQLAERFVAEAGQRAHLETTLSETSEQLETLTTAKAEFLANISHELRTPITVAKGIAYVLKNRGIPEEEQQEFLGKLESSLEKLMMLVDEMLTIADLDRGTLSLKISDVDLGPLLRHAADEIGRQYPDVEIEAQIAPGLLASADPVRIAEVTRQLLDNACRYSPEDEPVELRARSMTEGVVVSITDHGRGVERQLVAQAFNEPFSTSEDVLTKERDGAGVGLHMARQLIRQHGGIIWADPLPAGGTRISFCVPSRSGEQVTAQPTFGDDPKGAGPDRSAGAGGGGSNERGGFVALLPNAATSPKLSAS
jgi:signal transduction histidine kinase